MNVSWKKILWGVALLPFVVALAWLIHLDRCSKGHADPVRHDHVEPLRIVVTDPLSLALADAHAGDRPRHDYSSLVACLERRTGRRIDLRHSESLEDLLRLHPGQIDLIIGPASAVQFEAAQADEGIRPIARLTDAAGGTGLTGLFIVRRTDPARTIRDLTDHRVLFGPDGADETRSAALAALAQQGIVPVPPLQTASNYAAAALAVVEGGADAAVIPDYAQPLLKGGGEDKGALRVIGRTATVAFITAFATGEMTRAVEREIADALLSLRDDPQVLEALDSQAGFVGLQTEPVDRKHPLARPSVADWDGPDPCALSCPVPARLPAQVSFLWKRGLSGPGLSGVTATSRYVIAADKSSHGDRDIWRCLDAATGQEIWTIAYATPREMEFTNAPRATPVIHDDRVYLLGAFGDLHCVSLGDNRILWRRNIVKDFGAKLPTWGMCSTPLIVDDKLVVNPGAQDASLVALDLYTGEPHWKSPGEQAAYASLIRGTFGNVRQIVGYDATSLGGWDPNTGQRLWKLPLPEKGDCHVASPVDVDGRVLVSTANNGTCLYGFDADGRIRATPIACNHDLRPDTSTPILVDGLVFGCSRGLVCLDVNDSLKTLYAIKDGGAFRTHAAFMAGDGRVLAASVEGELILFSASRGSFASISRLQLFPGGEVWSRPALVGNRLYIRSMKEICCILLDK